MKCIICNNDCYVLDSAKYYFHGFNYCSVCKIEFKIYNKSTIAMIKVVDINNKEYDFYLNFLNTETKSFTSFTIYDYFADKKILQEEVDILSFKEGFEYLNKVSQKFINNLLFI